MSIVDISHLYGNDIAVSSTGDLAVAVGSTRTIQRIIRRLCTPATSSEQSAYPWEPAYGAGLPARIGKTMDPQLIQSIVLSQLLAEPTVSPVPAPTVDVVLVNAGAATISIKYTDTNGNPQGATFTTPQ